MTQLNRTLVALSLALVLCGSRPASAYSVLAHEAVVDTAWDAVIAHLLRERYPRETAQRISAARAYVYGGSVIQDLGYYPLGSHYFTNLVHYVRSGDFVEAMVRDATDVNEYAFALGALAHYASDNTGHPVAVNRAVPLLYPKDRSKFGPEVTFAESPKHHVMVEFAFDVTRVARGDYKAQAYHAFIGFQVATSLLERAFRETYALRLKDLFLDEDLAIGTYRYLVSKTIPEMTRLAWRDKRRKIQRLTPGTDASTFVYSLGRLEYEQEFGTKYRRPGILSRIAMFTLKIVPKVGPFRTLAFQPLTPDAEAMFLDSFARTRERYHAMLLDLRAGRLTLADTDFDVGTGPMRGRNTLADDTYDRLLGDLAQRRFADVPVELRRDIALYYGFGPGVTAADGKDARKPALLREQLLALAASR